MYKVPYSVIESACSSADILQLVKYYNKMNSARLIKELALFRSGSAIVFYYETYESLVL